MPSVTSVKDITKTRTPRRQSRTTREQDNEYCNYPRSHPTREFAVRTLHVDVHAFAGQRDLTQLQQGVDAALFADVLLIDRVLEPKVAQRCGGVAGHVRVRVTAQGDEAGDAVVHSPQLRPVVVAADTKNKQGRGGGGTPNNESIANTTST